MGKAKEQFSSGVNFGDVVAKKIDDQYFIGEAAGFQDCLAGFGMIYAFKSGFLVARSIIEDLDYESLLKRDVL